jgi:hypothetical protein
MWGTVLGMIILVHLIAVLVSHLSFHVVEARNKAAFAYLSIYGVKEGIKKIENKMTRKLVWLHLVTSPNLYPYVMLMGIADDALEWLLNEPPDSQNHEEEKEDK